MKGAADIESNVIRSADSVNNKEVLQIVVKVTHTHSDKWSKINFVLSTAVLCIDVSKKYYCE